MPQREIDKIISENFSELSRQVKLISQVKINIWHTLVIITFVAGFAAALIWSVSNEIINEGLSQLGGGGNKIENIARLTFEDDSGNSFGPILSNKTSVTLLELPVTPAAITITVNMVGAGGGAVSSSPAGIDCGSSCSAQFNAGAALVLTAIPNASSTFAGWSGSCSGTGDCSLTAAKDDFVTAEFALVDSGNNNPIPTVRHISVNIQQKFPDGGKFDGNTELFVMPQNFHPGDNFISKFSGISSSSPSFSANIYDDIPPSQYDVVIKKKGFLAKKILGVSWPPADLDFGDMIAGNLQDSDDEINSLDWSVMKNAWGSTDLTADINGDGIVNTLDWSVLNRNWGMSGGFGN